MKFTFDHDYHIHSCLSVCSKNPLQTKENILKNAKAAGLKSIELTDHFWDSAAIEPTTDFYRKQNLDHIKHIKECLEIEKQDCSCDVLSKIKNIIGE